jgi:hypothetical protein
MKSSVSPLLCCLLLLVGTVVVGCDLVKSQEEGRIRILLTDHPLDNAVEANVSIKRVELIGQGGSIVLMDETEEFDLLQLQNGVTALLAEFDVPAGPYTQLRVIVGEDAELVMNDDSRHKLKIPSGEQTGIKILLQLEVPEGGETEVVLDFDVYKSFVVQGNTGGFIFRPVITPLTVNGEDVDPGDDG